MFERFRKPAAPLPVVLYTRANCHLCEEMQAEISRAGREEHYVLRKVDVDSRRALKKAFGLRIPVLEIDGRVEFEGRLSATEFRARLDGAHRSRRARRRSEGPT
ncbi:MAG: glutaredoxin family protein [Planctomycetota bacterium]